MKGAWTKAALESKAAKQADYWERVRQLRDWSRVHDMKAWRALAEAPEAMTKGITAGVLNRALNGEIKHLDGRCQYDILTKSEEGKLVEWCKASARNAACVKEQQGRGEKELSAEIRKLLKVRAEMNKRVKNSVKLGTEPLTAAETSFLQRGSGGCVGHVWCQHFFARHPELDPAKAVSNQDDKRIFALATHGRMQTRSFAATPPRGRDGPRHNCRSRGASSSCCSSSDVAASPQSDSDCSAHGSESSAKPKYSAIWRAAARAVSTIPDLDLRQKSR